MKSTDAIANVKQHQNQRNLWLHHINKVCMFHLILIVTPTSLVLFMGGGGGLLNANGQNLLSLIKVICRWLSQKSRKS